MAVTLVGAQAFQGLGYSVTRSYTVGTGADRLIVAASWLFGNVFNNVTYAGVSLVDSGTAADINIRRLVAPTSGVNNISFVTANYSNVFALVSDWSGADQTTPLTALSSVLSGTGGDGVMLCTTNTVPAGGGVVFGVGRTNYTQAGAFSGGPGTVFLAGARYGGGGQTFSAGYRTTSGQPAIVQPTSFALSEAFSFGINPASGAPLLSAPGVFSITSSSARPRVTITV